MSINVVAVITPQPDHVDEVVAAFGDGIATTHAEDGCEFYALTRNATEIVTIEKWSSQAALDAHMAGPGIKTLLERAGALLAAPPNIIVLDPVPVGDPAKGTL